MHTYIQFNVQVQSAVYLVLQFQVLTLFLQIPLLSFPIYSIFDNRVTDAKTFAFNMVSELCIMVSFDI